MENILPKEICSRQKLGFSLPFEYWLVKKSNKSEIYKNFKIKDKELPTYKIWALKVLGNFDRSK